MVAPPDSLIVVTFPSDSCINGICRIRCDNSILCCCRCAAVGSGLDHTFFGASLKVRKTHVTPHPFKVRDCSRLSARESFSSRDQQQQQQQQATVTHCGGSNFLTSFFIPSTTFPRCSLRAFWTARKNKTKKTLGTSHTNTTVYLRYLHYD